MRELLEKWAALEPERGGLTNPDHSQRWVQHSGERWYFFVENRTALASILASVIEAIEAQRTSRGRGWTWTLRSPRNDAPQHVGLVYYANKQWKAGRGDTPAEALLTAYLAALEAEDEP